MAVRAKIRKTKTKNKQTFKQHILRGQRADFKINQQKCSTYGQAFTKIAKLVPTELKITKSSNDIAYFNSSSLY